MKINWPTGESADIICDRCNESCRTQICTDGSGQLTNAFITATGCYGSTFPPDMTEWHVDLCQFCFAWLVSTLARAPKVTGYDGTRADSARELAALMELRPRQLVRTYPGSASTDLERVLAKARLSLGPLSSAAFWKRTVADLVAKELESLPPPTVARKFSLRRHYKGFGAFEYELTQTAGDPLAGPHEAEEIMRKQWPDFGTPGVCTQDGGTGWRRWTWTIESEELKRLNAEQDALGMRMHEAMGDNGTYHVEEWAT